MEFPEDIESPLLMSRPVPDAHDKGGSLPVLVVTAGPYRCALPLVDVIETMRPLKVLPLAGLPAFVHGAAVIRGEAIPVVDLARLCGDRQGEFRRFVVIRGAEERRVALAVESVIGVKNLPQAHLTFVPDLLKKVQQEFLQALSCSDQSLLLVLRKARLVPDEDWEELAGTHVQLDEF